MRLLTFRDPVDGRPTLGVRYGQGNHLARPMPAAELRTWLLERQHGRLLDEAVAATAPGMPS